MEGLNLSKFGYLGPDVISYPGSSAAPPSETYLDKTYTVTELDFIKIEIFTNYYYRL